MNLMISVVIVVCNFVIIIETDFFKWTVLEMAVQFQAVCASRPRDSCKIGDDPTSVYRVPIAHFNSEVKCLKFRPFSCLKMFVKISCNDSKSSAISCKEISKSPAKLPRNRPNLLQQNSSCWQACCSLWVKSWNAEWNNFFPVVILWCCWCNT